MKTRTVNIQLQKFNKHSYTKGSPEHDIICQSVKRERKVLLLYNFSLKNLDINMCLNIDWLNTARRSSLKRRERAIDSPTNSGTLSQATFRKLMRDAVERMWAFPRAQIPS